ncbi:MAG: Crp/Fnr family transcriptional regulator [Actinomycetota bacterium]|nr:Crp/Fnr family transcriptional regulator [Actinomycetota bacterium]
MEWRLLKGLPEQDTRRLLAGARRRRFGKGEVLFHEGDPAASLHLVAKGRVAVRIGTPMGDVVTVELVGPGDLLGELALLSAGTTRAATAIAMEATETLSLDRETFRTLRRTDPGVTDVLVELLAERLRRLDARLMEALYVPADTRIVRRLLDLAGIYGDTIPLKQDDVAGLAGTTRATVNRVLRREERSGTVALGRGRVTLLDRPALARRAR